METHGPVWCFTTVEGSFECGDILTDPRDGQEYPTVQIGDQCWMAKNINIGEKIQDNIYQSDNEVLEKYCYDNDTEKCQSNGGLYNWDEMMQYDNEESAKGICQEGWHLPSDEEWIELEMFLGMSYEDAHLPNAWRGTDEGTQLKVGGSSGYESLFSGRWTDTGGFDLFDLFEYMWTSSEYGDEMAWRRCLREIPTVGRWNTFPKTYAFSARCLKD